MNNYNDINSFEDNNLKLPIEVVPQSSHYNNLRKILKSYEWAKLRKIIITPLNNKCSICSGSSPKRSLDLHEVWDYNNGIQKLVRLEGLCVYCHEVKHYYLANIKGNYKRASKRLQRINNWDSKTLIKYEKFIHNRFILRSSESWELDISLIEDFDLKLK